MFFFGGAMSSQMRPIAVSSEWVRFYNRIYARWYLFFVVSGWPSLPYLGLGSWDHSGGMSSLGAGHPFHLAVSVWRSDLVSIRRYRKCCILARFFIVWYLYDLRRRMVSRGGTVAVDDAMAPMRDGYGVSQGSPIGPSSFFPDLRWAVAWILMVPVDYVWVVAFVDDIVLTCAGVPRDELLAVCRLLHDAGLLHM